MTKRIVFVALAVLAIIPCTLNAQVHVRGLFNTLTSLIRIDSVTFTYRGGPEPVTVATPSWGGEAGIIDTFDFTTLLEWPNGPVLVYPAYRAESYPPDTLLSPKRDTWQTVRTPGDTAVVMFHFLTAIEERTPAGPVRLEVSSANPFAGQVEVSYSLPTEGYAELVVTNVVGRTEKTLAAGRLGAGRSVAFWDGTDDLRQAVDNGVYFVRLITNSGSATRKLILAR
jgi:hypothetical protein